MICANYLIRVSESCFIASNYFLLLFAEFGCLVVISGENYNTNNNNQSNKTIIKWKLLIYYINTTIIMKTKPLFALFIAILQI